jgi:signal peptidase I
MSTLTAALYAAAGRLSGRLVPGLLDWQLLVAAVHADGGDAGLLAGRALLLQAAREAAPEQPGAAGRARRADLARQGIEKVDGNIAEARERLLMQPWWLDWTAGLFPVILIVFLLRSFLFEPFKIPSGSMVPTLMVGDLILVNKFHYGVRLPVINKKIIDNNAVKRGDVMVFRYPIDPRLDYIKRVVGIPGDEVAYLNQKLSINGQPVPEAAQGEHYDDDSLSYAPMFTEKLGDVEHKIRVDPRQAGLLPDPKRSSRWRRELPLQFPKVWCARCRQATTS